MRLIFQPSVLSGFAPQSDKSVSREAFWFYTPMGGGAKYQSFSAFDILFTALALCKNHIKLSRVLRVL
jgi:hypothetical protein